MIENVRFYRDLERNGRANVQIEEAEKKQKDAESEFEQMKSSYCNGVNIQWPTVQGDPRN